MEKQRTRKEKVRVEKHRGEFQCGGVLQDGSEKRGSTRQTESSAQVLVTVNGPTGGSTLSPSPSNLLQVQVLILSPCFSISEENK